MKSKEEIIATNEKQAVFYDTKERNWITGLWSKVRTKSLGRIRKDLGIQSQIYATHKNWLGELQDKKVLDLGCYEGNALSVYMAERAKFYIGIDLSERGINVLATKLKGIPTAKVMAIDFLSENFQENDFDVVYAYGVIHHFENIDVLISRLKEVMTTDGVLITYDPLKTSLPVKILRAVYRPFQTDADWEWPFSKAVVKKLSQEFTVIERRSVLGRSKYAAFLSLIPISYSRKLALGERWHQKDWSLSLPNDTDFYKGMHATLHLKNR